MIPVFLWLPCFPISIGLVAREKGRTWIAWALFGCILAVPLLVIVLLIPYTKERRAILDGDIVTDRSSTKMQA